MSNSTRSINREAADPSIVLYKGLYYLFPSMSAGFWVSKDLFDWEFQTNTELPFYDYAPDIREINGYLYFCASKAGENCPIYRTKDPLSEKFEEISRPFEFWDPNLFQDDDGKVYLYWGCSNERPIWGIEMDAETMLPIGEKKALFQGQPDEHGWERIRNENISGNANSGDIFSDAPPYIEGAWMTKHEGRYYLQYAAPGTEYNNYGDGVYVGKSPLGPFEYADYNPVCLKPGGFIAGAGHGSTFMDHYGNYWHIASMGICINHLFERRLGLFPAGFDKEGLFFCNTNFGDYPMLIPDKKINPWEDLFAGWMLLSYKKKVTPSSSLGKFTGENIVDENIRTFWVAGTRQSDESVTLDLFETHDVNAIQINFSDYKVEAPMWNENDYHRLSEEKRHINTDHQRTRYLLEGSEDGIHWFILEDKRETETNLPHDYIVFAQVMKLRYLRITGYEMPYQGYFSLSGIRVFGRGKGPLPDPAVPTARMLDDLTAQVEWTKSNGAIGYNVRYGVHPDKLYHSWMVYESNDLLLSTLNKGVDYYLAVDAFNENGITTGEAIKIKNL